MSILRWPTSSGVPMPACRRSTNPSNACVNGSMAFAYVVALWGFVESGQRIGQGVVAQCDDDIENGGGPTMVVAPVSTATSRRRSKSTGPVASAVAGSLALR
jgi:hypothetical protein